MVWILVGAGVVFVIIFIAAIFATHEEMGIDKKYGTCTATFDLNAFDINQNVRIYDDSQVGNSLQLQRLALGRPECRHQGRQEQNGSYHKH